MIKISVHLVVDITFWKTYVKSTYFLFFKFLNQLYVFIDYRIKYFFMKY